MTTTIALSALPLALALAAPVPSAPPAIVALRNASGCANWSHVAALQISGTHDGDGLTGPFHESLDTRDGRSAIVVHEGTFVDAQGFDGHLAWLQDFSGASHPLDAAHARELARTDAWMERRGWCGDGDGTTYRSYGIRTHAGRAFDVVSATPRGGEPIAIWIDRGSHLIDRTEERLNESDEVTTFADWRTVGDVAIPFERRVDYPEDEDSESYHVRNVRSVTTLPDATYAAPPLPNDVRMVGGARSTRVPYVVEGIKPIVNVMLNGRGPFPFVIDTGGHFILTPATAARLGLGGTGSGNETGQGNGIRKVGFTTVREVRIGDAAIANQPAEIIPYGFHRLERGPRPPKAGWLGLQLFERFATTFDPRTHTISLAPLASSRPIAAGTRVPIVFDEDAPLVDCTIDARPGLCMIDTGNASPTIVEGNWIAKHRLAPTLQRGTLVLDGESLGRADIRIGSIHLPHAQISFAKPTIRGSEATTVEAAILSEGQLNRFTMTVDYGRHAVWFAPVPGAREPPLDRSGMFVDKDRDGNFSVWFVFPHSPAERAGVKVDDRIVAVDGIPSARLAGTDFREIAQGAVGSRHVYRIERKGKPNASVSVRLQDFLP